MFSNLSVLALTEFRKIISLDTDTILLRPLNHWFDSLNMKAFYAERSPSHKRINAGILALTPSEQTLESLIEYARNNEE